MKECVACSSWQQLHITWQQIKPGLITAVVPLCGRLQCYGSFVAFAKKVATLPSSSETADYDVSCVTLDTLVYVAAELADTTSGALQNQEDR